MLTILIVMKLHLELKFAITIQRSCINLCRIFVNFILVLYSLDTYFHNPTMPCNEVAPAYADAIAATIPNMISQVGCW